MKRITIGLLTVVAGVACGQSAVMWGVPPDYVPPDAGDVARLQGMPCDVAGIVQSQCLSCHTDPPTSLAPMPLLSRENFLAMRGTKSVGQLSVERMKNAAMPMPPGSSMPPAADTAVLEKWVMEGMPEGTCDTSTLPSPLDPNMPARCSSNTMWTRGDHESPDMHPGLACIRCHTDRRDGPSLKIAGTVYPSLREPDDCNGGGEDPSAAVIEIIDRNGNSTEFTPRNSGNFSDWKRSVSIAFPVRAKVHYNGKTRSMATVVTTGDCNSCHTQNGAESAPGRIVLP